MLDTLKSLAASTKLSAKDIAELRGLVDAVREERTMLQAIWSEISTSGVNFRQMRHALERFREESADTLTEIDQVSEQLERLSAQAAELNATIGTIQRERRAVARAGDTVAQAADKAGRRVNKVPAIATRTVRPSRHS